MSSSATIYDYISAAQQAVLAAQARSDVLLSSLQVNPVAAVQGASAEAATEVTTKTGILGRNVFSYVKMCGDQFCLQNRSCSNEHSLATQKQFFSHSKCLGGSASPVQSQPANMYSVLNCDVIDANDDLISSFGQAEITLAIKTLKKELEKKKKSSKKKKKKKIRTSVIFFHLLVQCQHEHLE